MSSEPQVQSEPDLADIQKAYPNLNLTEFLAALQSGGEQVILKTQETGETFELKIIASDTGSWIRAHPIQAGLIGLGAVTCIVPAVATTPLFMALGLGANGPIAGGVFALYQSVAGYIAAGGAAATLQSAAMGGAGAAVVNEVVAVTSAATGILTGMWGLKQKADKAAAGKKKRGDEKRNVFDR